MPCQQNLGKGYKGLHSFCQPTVGQQEGQGRLKLLLGMCCVHMPQR